MNIAKAALAFLLCVCLCFSCARARTASVPSGTLPSLEGGEAILLEISAADGRLALAPVKASELLPAGERLPWTEAVSVAALDLLDGRIALAVNRSGLAFLGRRGEAGLAWDCLPDPEFGDRTIISAWASGGRFYAFLAHSDAFEEGGEGDPPLPLLLSRAPGEAQYRRHPLSWQAGASEGWLTVFMAPAARSGRFLVQLSRRKGEGAESRYLSVSIDGSQVEELPWSEFLEGFEPLKASAMDSALSGLCDAPAALSRYESMQGFTRDDSAVVVDERCPGGLQKTWFLSGSPDALWMARISAWRTAGEVATLRPDGGFSHLSGGKAMEISLPALPPSFDYEKLASSGDGFWAAAWSETVFPATGRAGLAVFIAD